MIVFIIFKHTRHPCPHPNPHPSSLCTWWHTWRTSTETSQVSRALAWTLSPGQRTRTERVGRAASAPGRAAPALPRLAPRRGVSLARGEVRRRHVAARAAQRQSLTCLSRAGHALPRSLLHGERAGAAPVACVQDAGALAHGRALLLGDQAWGAVLRHRPAPHDRGVRGDQHRGWVGWSGLCRAGAAGRQRGGRCSVATVQAGLAARTRFAAAAR